MTSLDLGVLVGRATLDTTVFDRAYNAVIRKFSMLADKAAQSAAGVAKLDESLDTVGASADKAAAGLARAEKASTTTANAEAKAAVVAQRHAAAMAEVSGALAKVADASPRVQQATLRLAAAQERLDALQESGVATTRQLASAQAGLIGAQRSLTAAQEEGAAAGGKFRAGLASTLKMAGSLGLIVGAFEAVKTAIDITKEANEFARSMVQVQTNADVSAAEVTKASGALLAMAGPVAAAPTDLAVAWYHAKSVGLDYAHSIDTTRIAAEGARVGHADLEETMNALTSTVASGIPGVDNMSSAMGKLIAIVGSGDMKLSDLNQFLGSGILAIVKGYGLDLTDVGAAAATFGDNNIRGAEAATMLRMAVQAMAVPAKAGRDELTKLGLSATTLRDDMQTGGLNKALLDLKAHLDASGVSATEVGGVLTEVFGKRAGPGLSVLLGQMDRVQSKFAILNDSGASFNQKWKATTQTASFALASLWAQFQAGGIVLTQKLGPSIASTATWLGTNIPKAIHTLSDVLGPTVHLIGVGLVSAWHLATATLSAAGTVLGDTARLLDENKAAATGVAVAVGTMWLAFKGVALARVALVALSSGFTTMRLKAMYAVQAIMGMSAGTAALSGLAVGIGIVAYQWEKNKAAEAASAAAIKSDIDEITRTLNQETGAVTELTRAWVQQSLQQGGVLDIADKIGVSYRTVTNAALGNAAAQRAVTKAAQDNAFTSKLSGHEMLVLGAATHTTAGEVGSAQHRITQLTKAKKEDAAASGQSTTATDQNTKMLQWNIDAHGRLVQTSVKAGSAVDNTTAAITRQTIASGLLKNALDALNGVNETVEQTQDALSISIGNLANKSSLFTKKNGDVVTSLNQGTVAGATNRQMLAGLIDNAKAAAQAVADHARQQGHSLPTALNIGNAALKRNEDAIRAAAKAAGLNVPETNAMIASLGKLAKVNAKPKVDLDTSPAKTKATSIQAQIDAIRQRKGIFAYIDDTDALYRIGQLQTKLDNLHDKTVNITVRQGSTATTVKANAAGTQAAYGRSTIPPNTRFTVGEDGWEGGETDSQGRASIFPKQVARAMGYAEPKSYANGTKLTDAQQAAIATANTKASSALTSVSLDKSSFSWARFATQIVTAATAVAAAVKAGASAAQVASMDARLSRDEAKGAAIEHRLGMNIRSGAAKLGSSADNLNNVASRSDIAGQLKDEEGLLRQAGLPKSFIKSLDSNNKSILNAVGSRNQAAAQLAKANTRLKAAEATLKADRASFAEASTGSFDITSAGQDADGKVTKGSLAAAERQDLTRVRMWVAGIKKLAGLHIFPGTYLRTLAGKGPDALATVQALLSMNATELKSFAADQGSIASLAASGASTVATRLDGGAVATAQAQVTLWNGREKTRQQHLDKTLGHFADRVAHELQNLHLTGKLGLTAGQLALIVETGEAQNKKIIRRGGDSGSHTP